MPHFDVHSSKADLTCPGDRLSYSISDAAIATGLGRTTLYRLIAEGRLRKSKIGSRTLIRCRDLQLLLSPDDGEAK